ncbi:MAG: hypothetical protein P0Y65_20595 [Candidatus Devosia phytovorans]|uniref:Uncharacterized protein n=1 Tax=Candidatus Devosia phytovorans TaxID=3121372 RepID=A0AAJ5VUG7_9HYPH|nr:hypothetical protein [Devosia sp.]WEK04542.1 MAG: hypothetical protein P0Y65_20595 [Devosia sp.]
MRPAPRITPGEIVARAILYPNGAHLLEVAVPSGIVGMKFDAGQVAQLEAAIVEFKAQAVSADGGPDFHHIKSVPLEVSR